jgi:phosphoribosylamine--glycine ligase
MFHAGTKQSLKSKVQSLKSGVQITGSDENAIVTNGGRVLAVTSLGDTLKQALQKSYENAELIHYDGKYCRKDIGWEFL